MAAIVRKGAAALCLLGRDRWARLLIRRGPARAEQRGFEKAAPARSRPQGKPQCWAYGEGKIQHFPGIIPSHRSSFPK
jgi:hypothetical protein